jgi:hypothetical protein
MSHALHWAVLSGTPFGFALDGILPCIMALISENVIPPGMANFDSSLDHFSHL